MLISGIMIALGGAAGCLLRWVLSQELNPLFVTIPLGTLTANLLGGYLIGLAIAFFASYPGVSPHWRLLIITGFLGGLTTFSTFSAETALLIQQGRWTWACAEIAIHVIGSISMTLGGIVTVALWRQL